MNHVLHLALPKYCSIKIDASIFWEIAQLRKVPIVKKLFSNQDFLKIWTYAKTVLNSSKICALCVLIVPNGTLRLFEALFFHNID